VDSKKGKDKTQTNGKNHKKTKSVAKAQATGKTVQIDVGAEHDGLLFLM
jgi:hypothetical protein